MLGMSMDWMTASGDTLQNNATLRRIAVGISFSVRRISTSGWMPTSCSCFTECCVGFVFNSFAALRNGTYVKWMQMQLEPSSHFS